VSSPSGTKKKTGPSESALSSRELEARRTDLIPVFPGGLGTREKKPRMWAFLGHDLEKRKKRGGGRPGSAKRG